MLKKITLLRIGVGVIFLQACWVLADQGKEDFPLHFNASLTNSVGIGTFLSGYDQMPQYSTSLTFKPVYQFLRDSPVPSLSLKADFSLDVEWLAAYNSVGQVSRAQVRPSDVGIKLAMPKALDDKAYGFSIGPAVSIWAPASITSRLQNRVLALGAESNFSWKKWGFEIAYIPSFVGWFFSDVSKTISCDLGESGLSASNVVNPHSPDFDIQQYMWEHIVASEVDRLPNGKCVVAGRQTLGTLKNLLAASWSYGAHSIGLSLGWYLSFLRALEERPELQSPFAREKNTTESSLGQLSYTYTVPVQFAFNIEAGILSYQLNSALNDRGGIRFPFYDFFTPGNNFTQIYVDISMGI